MREEELEVAIKVVIVGNGAVGKSSMIQRYCKGTFTKDYKKTIGVDFLERQIELDGEEVRLMLWDTAGQEEFDAITKAYYRGAQACVLAFSTTDRDSFEAAHSWKMKVEDECGEIPTVLVQNKIDLLDQSVVDPEEAELLARALGCRLLRTSVKEDVNVAAVFRHLAAACLAEMQRQDDMDYCPVGGPLPPLTISAFSPNSQNGKSSHNNGTIVLRPGKQKNHKKKNVLRNACRIL
nr:ras-related protein Rab23 [Locusta migratoria]